MSYHCCSQLERVLAGYGLFHDSLEEEVNIFLTYILNECSLFLWSFLTCSSLMLFSPCEQESWISGKLSWTTVYAIFNISNSIFLVILLNGNGHYEMEANICSWSCLLKIILQEYIYKILMFEQDMINARLYSKHFKKGGINARRARPSLVAWDQF